MSWQTIETAPKDGAMVLLSDGEETVVGFWGGRKPRWWFWDGGCVWLEPVQEDFADLSWWEDGCGPTHWMPLPPPPTAE